MKNRLLETLKRLPQVGRYGLVLLTIFFISFLFPSDIRFKYEFQEGQIWRYDDLYAPFDFPIQKSEEELNQERERLDQEFSPYYQYYSEIPRNQRKVFEENFLSQLESYKDDPQFIDVVRNQKRYLQYGLRMIDRLYAEGIIELTPAHAKKPKDFIINVVRGNTAQKRTIQSLMDPKQAEELLTDSLPYSKLYVAEFLLPILPEAIIPNILYSDSLTNKFRSEQAGNIVTARGLVRKDDLIVAEGELITPDVHQKLASFRTSYLEKANGNHPYLRVFLGYILLTGIIIGVFILYLQVYAREIFHKFNHLIFVLMWMVVYSYLVFAVDQTNSLSAYIIPFCIVPIVVKIFYTDRLAFFTHIVVILIASFLSSLGYEFTILQILAGIVAVLSNPDARDWSKFFKSMLYIYLTYAVAHTGLMMIHEGEFILADGYFYIWIFLNVFLTLLAYPLIPLLERLFGFTSSISLMELSDMNRPLLRELALQAPGTLQHSLQVANLSEAAAQAIGADQLLVKVAALYHDIGKTKRPEYFIENQSGNNPHNDIGHMESAKVIIDHVVEGAKMAKKYRLPKVLIDFIMTHHGTTRVEYFYRLYVKDNPEKEFDEQIFRYPGPKPVSKEQTILMIADSLEAASKSLKNPTGKDIDDLVNKIIAGKISLGQLDDSKMTFEELEICKNVFRSLLRSINHVRVEYPEEPKTTEVEE